MNDKNFQKAKNSNFTLNDLFKGKDLDIVAASLLLVGKLKVDSVELFRNSPVIQVTLLGKFQAKDDDKVNDLVDFFEKNGDMTLDDVFDAINKRMNKKRR